MRNVYFYPAEFNTYAGTGANLTYRADINGSWRKEYKIFDHLGDIRSVVNDMGVTEGKYDYEPFGKKMTVLNNRNRLTFIGKENDFESQFGDFGVRKYDDETGRFTSVDPLWEKFYGQTPYHYCNNQPIMMVDPTGDAGVLAIPGIYIGIGIGIGIVGWAYTEATNPGTTQGFAQAVSDAAHSATQDMKDMFGGSGTRTYQSQRPTPACPSDATSVKVNVPMPNTTNPPPPPAPQPEPEKKKDKKAPSNNQIQQMIEKKQTPKSVDRIDYKDLGPNEKVHIHFKKGNHALNIDGTWKHGGRTLTNKEINFFKKIGWNLPKK